MTLPDSYRLLSIFSGVPQKTVAALKASGLWQPAADSEPIPDHLRGLLRTLAGDGRIRWVTWGPDGSGYVLTSLGESALDVYHQRYGPAHAPRRGPSLRELLRERAINARHLELEAAEGL